MGTQDYGYAVAQQRQVIKDTKVRLFTAGCLSSVLPGAGHLLRKLNLRGALWLAGFLLFLAGTVLLRPWHGADGMIAAILAGTVLVGASGIDAAYGSVQEDLRPTRWAVVLLLCIAFVASAIGNEQIWRLTGFMTFAIPSSAMAPTIARGESIVADMHAYRGAVPHRGDIVIFDNPQDLSHPLVKRVIAIPGDTIQGVHGKITLNGVNIVESYVNDEGGAYPIISYPSDNQYDMARKTYDFGPVKLGPGEYFVMGDNRSTSYDSRHTGPVHLSSIRGKALFIVDNSNSIRDGRVLN